MFVVVDARIVGHSIIGGFYKLLYRSASGESQACSPLSTQVMHKHFVAEACWYPGSLYDD